MVVETWFFIEIYDYVWIIFPYLIKFNGLKIITNN